jgi:hypothetical protein
MGNLDLFPGEQVVGVFRGFQEGGLEFHADLVLPYRNEFQNLPMHGQFLLVQLESQDEAVLGRITGFSSEGKLSSGTGEEFNIRAVRENRPVPEDLREQYLKYRVNIRVLGVLRKNRAGGLTFVASHRRLPHVGSPVAFPSGPVLQEIAGHNCLGAPVGHFALGEFVYASGSQQLQTEEWMQIKSPEILIRFPVENLVSRRTFIFARAGFGKSNLNKLLFSQLYAETPMVLKRGNRPVPVGTIIFDPDGEYFWPDDKGRPGLCDVPTLQDKLVVFTSRQSQSAFYQSFVAGGIKLDIRRLNPADVIAIALPLDRQEQQNVRKLRGLGQGRWQQLVDVIDRQGNQAPIDEIANLLDLDAIKQEAEALAARANMTAIVRMLHDKSSQLLDKLMYALARGKLCVIDVSQMRGGQSMILGGLILRRIFDRNQQEFTAAESKTIPTIAVIEEAQAVLTEGAAASEPYVAWVKEGRKYDLGAVLITQQPGSIPSEILSQGDNWFLFHLLSAVDLTNVHRANAHFSDDLLSVLLNEPIPGHSVFWSSVSGKPYPVSLRVLSFEQMYHPLDPDYAEAAVDTFAATLSREFDTPIMPAPGRLPKPNGHGASPIPGIPLQPALLVDEEVATDEGPDRYVLMVQQAISELQTNAKLMAKLKDPGRGAAWGEVKALFNEVLPKNIDNRDDVAFRLVSQAMTEIFGKQHETWEAFRHPTRGVTYVRVVTKG